MKIRTSKYIIKEGCLNAYRNKLMSLASISIVSASLIIFGIFLLITVNLSNIVGNVEGQPQIKAFCKPELDDTQIKQIGETIAKDSRVKETKMVSKQEAFEAVKKMVDNREGVLDGLDSSFLPVSFDVKLKDPKDSKDVVEQFKKIQGIYKVRYSQEAVDFIIKMGYWIRVISVMLMGILLVISMFIISNTIKLTVFARRKEISIMKYIGATDWFIRWPFIIEGIIIGFIGALIAFIVISYGYSGLAGKLNADMMYSNISMIKLIKMQDIGLRIIGIFMAIGAAVGVLGSVISLRKHLHV